MRCEIRVMMRNSIRTNNSSFIVGLIKKNISDNKIKMKEYGMIEMNIMSLLGQAEVIYLANY